MRAQFKLKSNSSLQASGLRVFPRGPAQFHSVRQYATRPGALACIHSFLPSHRFIKLPENLPLPFSVNPDVQRLSQH